MPNGRMEMSGIFGGMFGGYGFVVLIVILIVGISVRLITGGGIGRVIYKRLKKQKEKEQSNNKLL